MLNLRSETTKTNWDEVDVEELKARAEAGDPAAQSELGVRYLHGVKGCRQLPKSAFKWIQRAAKQGLAPAQYNLGLMYEKGLGVEEDCKQAVQWYKRAAEQGFAPAQNNLGIMYKNGLGVEQNFKQAAQWYKRAAEQGHATAQYNLGLMYDEGSGVEQDFEKAFTYYQDALKNSHREEEELQKKIQRSVKENLVKLHGELLGYVRDNLSTQFKRQVLDYSALADKIVKVIGTHYSPSRQKPARSSDSAPDPATGSVK